MKRLLMPVIGTAFLCVQSICVLAAETSSATTADTRAQIEAKRDQISGVDAVAKTVTPSTNTLLDAPVETDDAPAQVQQP